MTQRPEAQGRVALVTGANRGLGLAIAHGLAERGLTVLLTARRLASAEEAAADLRADGLRAVPQQLDVTDQHSVTGAIRRAAVDFGRLDVLVNNAAIFDEGDERVQSVDLRVVRNSLETNLVGPWRLCQAVVPMMLQQEYGRIVNVTSNMGTFSQAGRGSPAYRVSKAALNMLTVTLAADLAGTPILVNAVCPGWVRTDMGGPHASRSPEQGADTPIWLATLPEDGPRGGFFHDRQRVAW